MSPAELLPIAAALPEGEASKYVAGAYIVFVLLLVVYLSIMAIKVQRIERDLRELAGFAESRKAGERASASDERSQAAPGREAEEVASDV